MNQVHPAECKYYIGKKGKGRQTDLANIKINFFVVNCEIAESNSEKQPKIKVKMTYFTAVKHTKFEVFWFVKKQLNN